MAISEPTQLQIYTENLPDLPTFHLVKVEGGTFTMGDDESEDDREKPAHEVKVSSFWMGQHQVTQELWEAIMGPKENRSYFRAPNRPLEQVSWYDAVEFCVQLSKLQDLTPVYKIDKTTQDPNNKSSVDKQKWLVQADHKANGYRLPTEAEWEFAARGGIYNNGYEYAGSNDLEKVGWYGENNDREPQPPGLRLPNELGIYDLSGNVEEWCWDWYGPYMDAYMENPTGHISGRLRVLRGGSWYSYPAYCRVAYRDGWLPDSRGSGLGLRLSRTGL